MTSIFHHLFTNRKLILILSFTLHFLTTSAQGDVSEKIHFYEDTLQMKTEIIKYIPIGSNIENATDILKKNKLKYQMIKDSEFSNGNSVMEHIDYLYCDVSKAGKNFISKRWQLAIVHEDGKVTDVLVSFGLIGL